MFLDERHHCLRFDLNPDPIYPIQAGEILDPDAVSSMLLVLHDWTVEWKENWPDEHHLMRYSEICPFSSNAE